MKYTNHEPKKVFINLKIINLWPKSSATNYSEVVLKSQYSEARNWYKLAGILDYIICSRSVMATH